MGHWSESEDLLEEARQRIARGPGRPQPTLDELAPYLREAAREIELLAGRTFSPPRTATRFFESDGLPFIEVPDFIVGSESELTPDIYPIPDPVRPTIAIAFQTGRWPAEERGKSALPTSEALWWAGHALHRWHTDERFDQDFAMVRYTDRARAAGGPSSGIGSSPCGSPRSASDAPSVELIGDAGDAVSPPFVELHERQSTAQLVMSSGAPPAASGTT